MIARTRGRVEAILPADPWLIVHNSANNKQRAGVYEGESGRFVRELVTADSIGHFNGRLALAPDKRTLFSTFETGVAVVERRGRYIASIFKDGTEARRIDLGAAMTLSGKEATRARVALDGERAAVICETTLYRESPFLTPPELAVLDLASGAILFTHTLERDIGSVRFDGDALIYATCGGRVEWLPVRGR
jgi:hypothetical protein